MNKLFNIFSTKKIGNKIIGSSSSVVKFFLYLFVVLIVFIGIIISIKKINIGKDQNLFSLKNETLKIVNTINEYCLTIGRQYDSCARVVTDYRDILDDTDLIISNAIMGDNDVAEISVSKDNYVCNYIRGKIKCYKDINVRKLIDLLYKNKDISNAPGTYNIVNTKINGRLVDKLTGLKSNNYLMKNYVWYSGQLWQVLEINDEGIKIVTADSLTSITYSSGSSNFDNSWVKDWLDNVFYPELSSQNIIVSTTTCVDVVSSDKSTGGLFVNYKNVDECSERGTREYNVSLMTIEDYLYTGAGASKSNDMSSFVDTDEQMWLLTPSSTDTLWATYFYSSDSGVLTDEEYPINSYGKGVRPVITINRDVFVKNGSDFKVGKSTYAYGTKYNPYILTSNIDLAVNNKIRNLTVGEYVYLDESKNPYKAAVQKTSDNVTYAASKKKVRYRVVKINGDGSVKIERADILRELPIGQISYLNDDMAPYYYEISNSASSSCFKDVYGHYFDKKVKKGYYAGCVNHNYFNPTDGSGDYNYQDGENIAYFLNNATNSFYSWYSNSTKKLIKLSDWELTTTNYGRKYNMSSNQNDDSDNYWEHDNDGIVSAYVGLPNWGEMYSGNDINISYWLINRWLDNKFSVGIISSLGLGTGSFAGNTEVAVRPVVNIKSEVIIKGGAGTPIEPYEIDIDM